MRRPRTLTPRLVYLVIGWLMPTAVLVRLGFAFFSFLWLKCGCDVDDGFAGEFRPPGDRDDLLLRARDPHALLPPPGGMGGVLLRAEAAQGHQRRVT